MQCATHVERLGKYFCPRCGRPYCSLTCFKEFHGDCDAGLKSDVNTSELKGLKAEGSQIFGKTLLNINDKLNKGDAAIELGDSGAIFSEERLLALAQVLETKGLPDFSDFTEEELQYFKPEEMLDQSWRPWWQSERDSGQVEDVLHICCAVANDSLELPEHLWSCQFDIAYAIAVHALLHRYYQDDLMSLVRQYCFCEILRDACAVFDIPRKFKYQRHSEWQNEWVGMCDRDDRSVRPAYKTLSIWPDAEVDYRQAIEDASTIIQSRQDALFALKVLLRMLKKRGSHCSNCKELRRRLRLWQSVVMYHELVQLKDKFLRAQPSF